MNDNTQPDPQQEDRREIPLPRCKDVNLLASTKKGRGLFARNAISAHTIIDTSPVLVLDPQEVEEYVRHTKFWFYTFNWPYSPVTLDNIPPRSATLDGEAQLQSHHKHTHTHDHYNANDSSAADLEAETNDDITPSTQPPPQALSTPPPIPRQNTPSKPPQDQPTPSPKHRTSSPPPLPSPRHPLKTTTKTQALPLGLGSLFNHSTQHQNIGWTRNLVDETITYVALRDIEEGEELCISYGEAGRLGFVDADAVVEESVSVERAFEGLVIDGEEEEEKTRVVVDRY